MTHAAVCNNCDLRTETCDYIAASLVRDRHEEEADHDADVIPVSFEKCKGEE